MEREEKLMDKKILLVADDDDMNRRIIKKFLKSEYEVIEAADGQQALDILSEKHVDLLLLDIIMPCVDGLEVLNRMKQEKKNAHIGVLVATATKEKTEREALSRGADDVVSKPYDPVVIKKRLENILLVKEIEIQKELLQEADYYALFENKKEEMWQQMIASVTQMRKYIEIIRENKENYQLVDEILADMDAEIENAVNIVSKEN